MVRSDSWSRKCHCMSLNQCHLPENDPFIKLGGEPSFKLTYVLVYFLVLVFFLFILFHLSHPQLPQFLIFQIMLSSGFVSLCSSRSLCMYLHICVWTENFPSVGLCKIMFLFCPNTVLAIGSA